MKPQNDSVSGDPSHAVAKTIEDFDPPKKTNRNKFAFACAVLASMTSVLLGYGEFMIGFHCHTTQVYVYTYSNGCCLWLQISE